MISSVCVAPARLLARAMTTSAPRSPGVNDSLKLRNENRPWSVPRLAARHDRQLRLLGFLYRSDEPPCSHRIGGDGLLGEDMLPAANGGLELLRPVELLKLIGELE